MDRQRQSFRQGGGGRQGAPNSQYPLPPFNLNFLQNPNMFPPNPNFPSFINPLLQVPNFPLQDPNFPIPNPNFPAQNPNLPVQNPNLSAHRFPVRPQPPRHNETLERIDGAVVKARQDLLAAGESVSSWKVSQAALFTLQTDSWDSLGFQMQQVPSLRRLMLIEGKINAIIHCFVGVRRITSLHDLGMAICECEGVERFEDLGLGPLVRHPLVAHYFSVSLDVIEVFKITSEEIIWYLCEFMDNLKGGEVKAEELLDFIAKKQSVPDREKLSVRIQSLGMHISFIRKARRSETIVQKKLLGALKMESEKKQRKRPLLSSQKKLLDDHFCSISERIKSFSSEQEDFCGTHIRFSSSSSENEKGDNCQSEDNEESNVQSKCEFSSQNLNSSDRVSSCPYPSAAEEMTRLGLKSEIDCRPPACGSRRTVNTRLRRMRKRKYENISRTLSASNKLPKREKVKPDNLIDIRTERCSNQSEDAFLLSEDSLRMFVTTWKEACQESNVAQVFDRMLSFYNIKKHKQMRKMFKSFPCVGLLNVAVTCIKRGMWDSMYDTLQNFSEQGVTSTISVKHTDYTGMEVEQIDVEPIEVEPAEKMPLLTNKHLYPKKTISVENILEKASRFFELHSAILGTGNPTMEKKFILLKKLRECEFWLAEQFSVKEFESLGHGDFFMFLEKQFSFLPQELQKFFTSEICEKPSLEACMIQNQLTVLLSQAVSNLLENENLSKQKISDLLKRQFPSLCFKLVESSFLEDFRGIVRQSKSNALPNCLLFSATLSGIRCTGDSLVDNVNNLSEASGRGTDEIIHKEGSPGSSTTKKAIDILLRAPFLIDLNLWSHWDFIFAPSLGPLVSWLLNDISSKELFCLVTKDGQVIRIDQSATADSFLEALLLGSSFQTAVNLLSLFLLYGGKRNFPLALIKCHTQRAFGVMVKNFSETEQNETCLDNMHRKSLCLGNRFNENNLLKKLPNDRAGVNAGVAAVARFILDCLAYLPLEFCSFAADVLLPGFQSIVKDAPAIILSECNQMKQHLILHEVGLSLGIVEWIKDYHTCSYRATDPFNFSGSACFDTATSKFNTGRDCVEDTVHKISSSECEAGQRHGLNEDSCVVDSAEAGTDSFGSNSMLHLSVSEVNQNIDPVGVINSIRRDEFGLDPSISNVESNMLKKQHARLGRALHCLSQELYSQDSHFILELVQNADDNTYPVNVEPTLTFILQEGGIIILNNEQGFSEMNIRALCDVGNSTKRGLTAGYIGKKGIGFKSVFRVTDAPEIHSNGFHIKFDVSEGQIGFVLPTVVPPCDINVFSKLASEDYGQVNISCWRTCIVLPFRSKLSEGFAISNVISMFSDLHPSLLLFLHRLKCIKFKNMLNDSFIVMRKQEVGDGIVKVSHGKEKMTWLVVARKLRSDLIRSDVQTTEVSIAFTLHESGAGVYTPHLDQQPVFAFLPLRMYGLKFILQGDFILPSSREEVDGDSPWNQWLLSEFPDLFVGARSYFCSLPCFRLSPGKAVAAFMSFVPLVGEVHGFFSGLPRLILSKLRLSNCLLLEGNDTEWVPPCKVLRNWTEQARALLSDSLLREHLGLGFLNKDIVLSDSLARALGIEEYGPKILLQIMSSLCGTEKGLKSMGLDWLSCWLNALYMMSSYCSGEISSSLGTDFNLIARLQKISFIPLSDGTYGSVNEGTIWLPCDALGIGFADEHGQEIFTNLYAKLRIVSHALFSAAATVDPSSSGLLVTENLTQMLYKVGVQRLSAHDIVKVHILPAISDDRNTTGDKGLMIEYLSFVMLHLRSNCPSCSVDKEYILSELKYKALISTNHGYKRIAEVPIHFSRQFGNAIDVGKMINGIEVKWIEVDINYLQHPIMKSVSGGMLKWRNFFQDLGVTDFVKLVQVEKSASDMADIVFKNMMWNIDALSLRSIITDWESQELVHLLSQLSSTGDRKRCKYLLEVLDTLWDDDFSDKVTGYCKNNSSGESKPFNSSFMRVLYDSKWIASSMDCELHYPKDLFDDCGAVHSILGNIAPYAVPKVRSPKLLSSIGLKTQVTFDDALGMLQCWRSITPFKASLSQMSKFYTFIWNEMRTSKQKIVEEFHSGAFIFVPYSSGSTLDDVVPGVFLSPQEVYWHDTTGSTDQMRAIYGRQEPEEPLCPSSKMLCNIYPSLHDFFVNECGVNKIPAFQNYLQILLQLSNVSLPSQAAKTVFEVLQKWADELRSGLLSSEDVEYLKESLLKVEFVVLPTAQDKWVSLNPSFGLICWSDDESLQKEFRHVENIDFLHFGELNDSENEILRANLSSFIRRLGIPVLSELVTKEAVYYGPTDSSFKASLVNWALPYAQRYIYKYHPNKYFELKSSGFKNLNCLRVVAVEKLFYKNLIKRSDIRSKKRTECSCLLQDNVLYVTEDSDSHSIFIELSRVLVDGTPELHLANFLHMITAMAESGSTEEQTEFILSSQKVPKLPDGESVWSLSSVPLSTENEKTPMASFESTIVDEANSSKSKRKPGINSSWPPVDWKTAPGFDFARVNGFRTRACHSQIAKMDDTEEIVAQIDDSGPMEITCDLIVEEDSEAAEAASVFPDSETWNNQSDSSGNMASSNKNFVIDSVDPATASASVDMVTTSSAFYSGDGDQLYFDVPNQQQAFLTGRQGELVACKYFADDVGQAHVRWVNEANESGLPYDILVQRENSIEYIEVKATKSAKKNWLFISTREWQFAAEKGESFSIAHVVFQSTNQAKVSIYKNPVRLCQLGKLQLAVVIPKQQKGFSVS